MHDFGTCICEKTFATAFEMLIDNISHDGVKNGVTQELQSFIIQRASLFRADGGGFVQQSLLVELNVAGIDPQNLIKPKIRLFVLTE